MQHNRHFILCALLLISAMTSCLDDEYSQPARELPVLSISDVTMDEGNEENSFNFVVTLEGHSFTNVGVEYTIIDSTAKMGQDYEGPSEATLLFTVNQTVKTISVPIVTDYLKEEDEVFTVVLSNPVNATIHKGRGTGTILNDDILDQEIFIPQTGYSTPESYPGMTLVWQDEFDGEEINSDNWNYDIGTGNNGWGNNELQYYREENAFLLQGNLIIEARNEPFENRSYTSARLKTQGKQKFRYGRIDIRAVTPETQGFWPALWMLGANISQIGWPACGEIDIMELRGQQPDRVLGTVHFGASTAQHQSSGSGTLLPPGEKFSNTFHVYSLIWEEDSITWLVDDEAFFTFSRDDIGNNPYPFNNDFFFVMNVAVGGNFVGDPDENSVFPQHLIVDYVRVFQ